VHLHYPHTGKLALLFYINLNVNQLNPLRSPAFASTEVYRTPVQIRDYPNIDTVTTQDRTWTDMDRHHDRCGGSNERSLEYKKSMAVTSMGSAN